MAADQKYAAWEEIKVLTFTRAVAASWMVSLLDLMNRVQLNILGRHLYLQSNILDARYCNAHRLQACLEAALHARVTYPPMPEQCVQVYVCCR